MFKIGEKQIDEGKTYIIAEAGSNHNGKLSQAEQLIDIAAEAQADAVKFQTFKASKLYLPNSGNADYLKTSKSVYQIIKEMEMPLDWLPHLVKYCEKRKIDFLSTPFDKESASALNNVGVPAFKIASYSLSDIPLIKYISSFGKPLIVSTGAGTMNEVKETVNLLKKNHIDFALLQTVAKYPAPLEATNLKVLDTFRDSFNVAVGISDHSTNHLVVPMASVARGACILEKHFTLSREMEGPDHKFAVEPSELKDMVIMIRLVEKALGDGKKRVDTYEKELAEFAKVAVHAVRNINIGDTFTEENIAVIRPGKVKRGISPKYFESILGKKSKRNIKISEGIRQGDFK